LGVFQAAALLVAQSASQTNQLQYGWNLIAFEVVPTNPAPSAVFDTNIIKAAWTYDNPTGQWRQFGRPAPGQIEQNQFLPMANVELGRAYWVYFDGGFNTNWVINGVLPNSTYSLSFSSGWNLIGI